MKHFMLFISSLVILNSCGSKEFDAEAAAKEYCHCVEKKNSESDFFDARTYCDGILLQSNRFFRASYIEANYGRYMIFLSGGLRDSIAKFHLSFSDYIEKNCCKVAVENCDEHDALQKRRKLIDSLYSK